MPSPERLAIALVLFVQINAASAAEPKKLWELGGFQRPESVVVDAANNVLYVSNINGDMFAKDGNGSIAKVSLDGKIIAVDWVNGLDAPKGLAISGGTLYTADIDRLVAIDIVSGKITATYPAPEAVFLNDVAAGADGRIFTSDTMTNTIWVLDKGKLNPWLKDAKLDAPNGLLVEKDRLVVATIGRMPESKDPGAPGHLIAVALSDKAISDIGSGEPIGFLDGVEPLANGAFLVTDFISGAVSRVDAAGKTTKVIQLENTADLAYIPSTKLAVIPLTGIDKLVAYEVE